MRSRRRLPSAPLSWQGREAPAYAAPWAVIVRGRDWPASWWSSHPLEPDPDAASAPLLLGDAGQDEGARLLLHEGPGANGQLSQVRPRGAHVPAHPQVGLPTHCSEPRFLVGASPACATVPAGGCCVPSAESLAALHEGDPKEGPYRSPSHLAAGDCGGKGWDAERGGSRAATPRVGRGQCGPRSPPATAPAPSPTGPPSPAPTAAPATWTSRSCSSTVWTTTAATPTAW